MNNRSTTQVGTAWQGSPPAPSSGKYLVAPGPDFRRQQSRL